ncbi:Unknown protein [Striga hermonthica]|uniref:S-protein homolog n=1 Tax=Striga hermonthica TaxID=68872 RepID=A0A9N7MGR0_STRHE|nr:Unknown protein [Striga hermonthica]
MATLHKSSSSNTTLDFDCKYKLFVKNNLPYTRGQFGTMLSVHCFSRYEDFGYDLIGLDRTVNFTLCSNPRSTQYLCTLQWVNKTVDITIRAFEAYNDDRCYRTNLCFYAALRDGIYFTGNYPPTDLTLNHPWS